MFAKFPAVFDPDDQGDHTFRFMLEPDESISVSHVDIVDAASQNVLPSSPVQILTQSHGQISGQLWGVTVWLDTDGTVSRADVFLRCKIETDSLPFPRKLTQTLRLLVRQR